MKVYTLQNNADFENLLKIENSNILAALMLPDFIETLLFRINNYTVLNLYIY